MESKTIWLAKDYSSQCYMYADKPTFKNGEWNTTDDGDVERVSMEFIDSLGINEYLTDKEPLEVTITLKK